MRVGRSLLDERWREVIAHRLFSSIKEALLEANSNQLKVQTQEGRAKSEEQTRRLKSTKNFDHGSPKRERWSHLNQVRWNKLWSGYALFEMRLHVRCGKVLLFWPAEDSPPSTQSTDKMYLRVSLFVKLAVLSLEQNYRSRKSRQSRFYKDDVRSGQIIGWSLSFQSVRWLHVAVGFL